MRARPTVHKKPSWRPRVSEGVIESAATLKPEDRYYKKLFDNAGYKPDSEVFQMLLDEEILEYPEDEDFVSAGHVYKRSISFTPGGAEYALECVSARLAELRAVKRGLIAEIARLSIEHADQD